MEPANLPLVSIVTPSFQMARYLPETIESVLGQNYPRIEYIVVDGGSTDGSLEILDKYGDRLQYVVGKDKGPSDAAHKGFQRATGEIFAWMNADDTYLPGAVRTGVEYLLSHPDVDVVYGEGNWIDENGAVIRRYPTLSFDVKTLARECFICQPASFMRSAWYRRCGLDPDVNLPFDYDLWIRMSKAGARFARIPQYLANSRMHSGAKTLYERDDVFRASMRLLQRHYGYVPLNWVLGYTAYRRDRRDQFFQPLQLSLGNYLASLPAGLRINAGRRARFLADWLAAPFGALARRRKSERTQ
jgi:glycosyltransferase involved in cell wall biosynthesis